VKHNHRQVSYFSELYKNGNKKPDGVCFIFEAETYSLLDRLNEVMCIGCLFYCFVPALTAGTSHTGGALKSLARLGKKQATAAEDFDVHISYL
jgi:hypothetical protein